MTTATTEIFAIFDVMLKQYVARFEEDYDDGVRFVEAVRSLAKAHFFDDAATAQRVRNKLCTLRTGEVTTQFVIHRVIQRLEVVEVRQRIVKEIVTPVKGKTRA